MRIIGLTGGIGSGKTTVSDYLISKGYGVIDADKIAREILKGEYKDGRNLGEEKKTTNDNEPESTALERVVNLFGMEILHDDKTLNRGELGSIVFSDTIKRKALEKIVHAQIFIEIDEEIESFKKAGRSVIFLDAPLLFEVKLDKLTDENWLVDVDDEKRIDRVIKRDGLPREEIENRIKNQMTREEKLQLADVVIPNNGSIEDLYKKINSLLF